MRHVVQTNRHGRSPLTMLMIAMGDYYDNQTELARELGAGSKGAIRVKIHMRATVEPRATM